MWKLLALNLIQAVLCAYKTDFTDPASLQLDTYRRNHHEHVTLVSDFGTPTDNIDATLTPGSRGPLLVEDTTFFERLAHFARERVPERTVHAKGTGAFGTFTVTNPATNYTKARFLSKVGINTPVAVRFSTSTGSRGSPDTVRDLRGFAIKLYTDEGIMDLLTLATPTFFIRDPMLFPQLTHALKNNPATNLKDFNMFWDFMSQRPETLLQLLFIYGEQGIPDCYRRIPGFAANTYKLVNENGEVCLAKFQLKADLPYRSLTNEQAMNISASDPDYCVRDLYNAIAHGDYPKWTFGIQVMTLEQANNLTFNPFDVTKLWQEEDYPFMEIGRLVLNGNPTNHFEQVEEIAFNPGHLVPGIELTTDKVLQGRMFIYGDTQRYRIGPNFQQMSINTPPNKVSNYMRDGPQVFTNQGSGPNYYPSRFGGPVPTTRGEKATYHACGSVQRYAETDNYSEPNRLYSKLTESQKEFLVSNLVEDIKKAIPEIQESAVESFMPIGDLGKRLEMRLNQ